MWGGISGRIYEKWFSFRLFLVLGLNLFRESQSQAAFLVIMFCIRWTRATREFDFLHNFPGSLLLLLHWGMLGVINVAAQLHIVGWPAGTTVNYVCRFGW